MHNLLKYHQIRLSNINDKFVRYLYNEINWEDRLIGITGARGTGKTTLMLQYIKSRFSSSPKALYVSLDDFYFTKKRLTEIAEEFYLHGGRYLFIDEVHKYPNWSIEIKNLYDIYVDLNIVFSGSSALELHKAKGDLSRRAAKYHLHELSFREYLNLSQSTNIKEFSLEEILYNHNEIVPKIVRDRSIIADFKNYLAFGVYPFFIDTKAQFYDRLVNTVNIIIENDLPAIENINYRTTAKLRKIISLIADSVPFKINISELSRKAEISRDVLLNLLHSLDRANIIKGIRQKGAATGHLTKPDKIYLNNTALLTALSSNIQQLKGTIRETFFMNQLIVKHNVNTIPKADFLIDNKYTFEIGGKNKAKTQITDIENAYIAMDNIEFGFRNTIPLWLFGFLY